MYKELIMAIETNDQGIEIGVSFATINPSITDDTTTAAEMYLSWVTTTTGNLPIKVSSTKLKFNLSTGVLTATGGMTGGTF